MKRGLTPFWFLQERWEPAAGLGGPRAGAPGRQNQAQGTMGSGDSPVPTWDLHPGSIPLAGLRPEVMALGQLDTGMLGLRHMGLHPAPAPSFWQVKGCDCCPGCRGGRDHILTIPRWVLSLGTQHCSCPGASPFQAGPTMPAGTGRDRQLMGAVGPFCCGAEHWSWHRASSVLVLGAVKTLHPPFPSTHMMLWSSSDFLILRMKALGGSIGASP